MIQEIIDGDKFILDHVYKPFQDMVGLGFDTKLTKQPYDNNKTIKLLKENKEWSDMVIDRIRRCKFRYNKRLNHPVINYIKTQI